MIPTLQKPLLYRSVNTRTHGVRHGSCRAYRYERHSKKEQRALSTRGSMHSHHQHGFDYTPAIPLSPLQSRPPLGSGFQRSQRSPGSSRAGVLDGCAA